MNVIKWRAMTAEKALELVEQKVNDALSKLGETKLKLTKIANLLSARDNELTNYKGGVKAQK